jgi:hypothetical protein
MSKVFISGSISIKKLPICVEESIKKIIDSKLKILVGDADGIDTMVQNHCKKLNYNFVTVYSIYKSPRYKVEGFCNKYIVAQSDSKKERELQQEKDKAMTLDSEYSFIIWDGKSKGSYHNILRAIDNEKKIKLYLSNENKFLESIKITKNEIEYLYRKNNGYAASEIVEYLKKEGEEFFQNTRLFNKFLLDNNVIKKEESVYIPMPDYEYLFFIDKYRGKIKGIRFRNEFINWIEAWIEKNKQPEEFDLFHI